MENFKGIYTALITPFDKNDNINESALKDLIAFNIKKGVTGFYVSGSAAEAFLLSLKERKKLLEVSKEEAGDKVILIAHIGCISTKHSIELALHAQKLGYHAISAVSPFYYGFNTEEIKAHYLDIANAVDLPLLAYNIPSRTGISLNEDNFKDVLANDRVIGIKFTSNDFFGLERFKNAYKDKLFFNGYDEMFLSGMIMGADGGIGSTYNFMADKFVNMYNLFNNGQIAEAQEIQHNVNEIIKAMLKTGFAASQKEILTQLGIPAGNCRAPVKPLTHEQKLYINNTIMPLL